jgi:hypothetical protein
MSAEIFHHRGGGFALASAAYSLDERGVAVEVAVGDAIHSVRLAGSDVQRFAHTIAISGVHYHWPGRAIPQQSTLYEVEVDTGGRPQRVTWWWAGQDGKLSGADARAFLRSAGVLKTCQSCAEERLMAPELRICDRCGFYAEETWADTRALLDGLTR